MAPPFLSFSDLPPATTAAMPVAYDLATLFEPMAQTSWAIQQRAMDQRQYLSAGPSSTTSGSLQAVARELSNRHGSSSTLPMPSSNASSSLSLSK
ncbi:LOB domain-containing protein 18 [Sesbania bispinosa]|nr:LOB domain-containing protein 18 [Sesbania bispinosa]